MSQSANLLQLSAGAKSFGAQQIFTDATFSINAGEHVGVIGPNGAGKTTLFKILSGEESLESGRVIRSQSLSLAYLSQHDIWQPEDTGNSYLERVSHLPLWQVKSLGKNLRVREEQFSQPINTLSGGYRMRLKLMGLLSSEPNLLLLDEPTNYLDLETTLLLEQFLLDFEGAFLLISHDREFLRRTTDHILEIENGEIVKYNGNIDDYFEQKELLQSQLAARARNQAEKRKAVLEFVARFGAKAAKAKQAQSRLRSLSKMEAIELKPVAVTAAIRIPEPTRVGKSILHLRQASFGYSEKSILNKVDLEIQRGDHVAVVGVNGAGKSTLLKGLAGTLSPQQGTRDLGYQVQLAIFNQHVVEILKPMHTVYEALEDANMAASSQEIRNMAGSLLFSSSQIDKKIKVLSGGEKSRVALGRILLQKVPFLLLDEPTNHLDFQTVEALTQALNKYSGTLVVVSHDRGFIGRVATKILEVRDGHVRLYPGTYDEYVWHLQQNLFAESKPESGSAPPTSFPQIKPVANPHHAARKELKVLEKNLIKLEQEIAQLEAENQQLNHDIMLNSSNTQAIAKLAKNSERLSVLEDDWGQLVGQIEALKQKN